MTQPLHQIDETVRDAAERVLAEDTVHNATQRFVAEQFQRAEQDKTAEELGESLGEAFEALNERTVTRTVVNTVQDEMTESSRVEDLAATLGANVTENAAGVSPFYRSDVKRRPHGI